MAAFAIPGIIGGISSMLSNRSAKRQAQQQQRTAAAQAGQANAQENAERAQIIPMYQRWMNAQHSLTPGQMSTIETPQLAAAASAANAGAAKLAGDGSRTHNASAVAKGQDELARQKMASQAGAAEKVAAQDVLGARELQKMGTEGMAGLRGQDAELMAKEQQLQQGATGQELEASNNLMEGASSMAQMPGQIAKAFQGAQAPGSTPAAPGNVPAPNTSQFWTGFDEGGPAERAKKPRWSMPQES